MYRMHSAAAHNKKLGWGTLKIWGCPCHYCLSIVVSLVIMSRLRCRLIWSRRLRLRCCRRAPRRLRRRCVTEIVIVGLYQRLYSGIYVDIAIV